MRMYPTVVVLLGRAEQMSWCRVLFLSKNKFEVMRINCGIASILHFRINIISSSVRVSVLVLRQPE